MELEILTHDKVNGKAHLRFSHNGIVHTDNYDLKLVIPGTDRVLREYDLAFTEEMQQQVIDKLTAQVQKAIEDGILHNPI
jgi:hypothetical protein